MPQSHRLKFPEHTSNYVKDFALHIFALSVASVGLVVLVMLDLPQLDIRDDYYFGTSLGVNCRVVQGICCGPVATSLAGNHKGSLP